MFRDFVYVSVQANAEIGFLFKDLSYELLAGHACEDSENLPLPGACATAAATARRQAQIFMMIKIGYDPRLS